MPLLKECKLCGKSFRTKPFFVKNGGGKYCSAECHHKGMRTGKIIKCFLCKKESYKPKAKYESVESKKFFCSKSCQTKWRNSVFIGEKHANWVDGKYSYRGVMERNKIPAICKLCKTRDKRVLAVHHVDKNKKNNNVENLMWLCHNCHHLAHHYNALGVV